MSAAAKLTKSATVKRRRHCPKCQKLFTARGLQRHVNTHLNKHKDAVTTVKVKCHACGETMTRKAMLVHWTAKHRNTQTQNRNSLKQVLHQHVSQQDSVMQTEPVHPQSEICCPYCGRAFEIMFVRNIFKIVSRHEVRLNKESDL